MTTLAELVQRVDVAFERTEARYPGWADPHPDRSPSDDEYSRVTDPAKWRIVGARAQAWLDALAATGLARLRPGAEIVWPDLPGPIVTASTMAVPLVDGALPLVVARSRIESVDDAGVTLAVGDPAIGLVGIPDCGCDACDSGSQDALDELDEHVIAVVTGEFRRLQRGRQSVTLLGDRRQARNLNRRSVEAVLSKPPNGWHEQHGPSWLSPR